MKDVEIEYGVRYIGVGDVPWVEQCRDEAEARARHVLRLRKDETAQYVTRTVTTTWTEWSARPDDQPKPDDQEGTT